MCIKFCSRSRDEIGEFGGFKVDLKRENLIMQVMGKVIIFPGLLKASLSLHVL